MGTTKQLSTKNKMTLSSPLGRRAGDEGELEDEVVCSILEHTAIHGTVLGKTQRKQDVSIAKNYLEMEKEILDISKKRSNK